MNLHVVCCSGYVVSYRGSYEFESATTDEMAYVITTTPPSKKIVTSEGKNPNRARPLFIDTCFMAESY